jgi:hypothetical protein
MTETVHVRALHKAAKLLGGAAELRHYLRAPAEDLVRWMDGQATPPTQVFLKVVDLFISRNEPLDDFSSPDGLRGAERSRPPAPD